jgi:hypothetical protein
MHMQASLNESARCTGARGRDRREEDEVDVDMVDTERWSAKDVLSSETRQSHRKSA